MIYWLFQGYFSEAGRGFRFVAAGAMSFVLVLLLGPPTIRLLIRRKIGDVPDFDRADLNELNRHNSNTPTMGGVLIVLAIFVSVVLFADLSNMYIKAALVPLIWLGGVGAWDDWLKLSSAAQGTGRDGLKTWEKLVHQIGVAVVVSVFVWKYGENSLIVLAGGERVNPAHSLFLPFGDAPIPLYLLGYTLIMVIVMVGSSNAVNLTDGMDGLAGGCLIMVAAVFLVVSWIVGVQAWAQSEVFSLPFVPYSAEMTVLCASMIGAVLGFLWFNAHPAQVFMGDTGSLPLGGLLGYIAVITRQELVLVIAGGVFVMETLSVILQVGVFKLTKGRGGMGGRRLFRCAPIHHHFHLGGWPATKVVARFWILGAIFAGLALAVLKLR